MTEAPLCHVWLWLTVWTTASHHSGLCIFIGNLPLVKRGEQQKGGGGGKGWDFLEASFLCGSAGWKMFKSRESPKHCLGSRMMEAGKSQLCFSVILLWPDLTCTPRAQSCDFSCSSCFDICVLVLLLHSRTTVS